MRRRHSIPLLTVFALLILAGQSASAILPVSFSSIVKLRAKSVVNISTTKIIRKRPPLIPSLPGSPFFGKERKLKRQSLGSGFIIEENGYILTNYHVIDKAKDIRVKLWDETEYKAAVVGTDPKTDLALIKVEPDSPLPIAPLGNSDTLEVGDWIIVIGNPYGLGHTVTAGIVSAKSRVISSGPYDDFIQTDAAINPGNSGGPLFNTNGEVSGISTAIYSPSGGSVGIGFAIPINIAKEIVSLLKEKGVVERGWLGVTAQKVTSEIAESFGLHDIRGALVTDTAADSPAREAGLLRGDILLEYNGQKIVNLHILTRLVALTPVGTTVPLVVFRNGREVSLDVKIKKLKEDIVPPDQALEDRLGIKAKTLHQALAEQSGITDGGAVIISEVLQESIAARKNIQKDDIILEINRKRVKSINELVAALSSIKKESAILLLIKRGTGYLYVSIKPE